MADPPLPPDPDKPDGWHEVIQPPTKLADKVPRRLDSDPAQQLQRGRAGGGERRTQLRRPYGARTGNPGYGA